MSQAVQWPRDWQAPIPERFQGLIFDCDGTIVDTMPVHYAAWVKALTPLGLKFPEERFYSFAGALSTTIVQTISREQGVTCDPVQVAHQKEEIYEASLRNLEPIHSVVAIARREKAHRRLAVASGGRKQAVKASLSVIDVDHLFEVIVGAEDVVLGKPSPELFLKAAQLLGLQPNACLVYEDGDLGIQAARSAGMEFIDVRPWYLPRR
ncbi:MAG TPA: HAD family phosphatase [Phycisphaerae bacterium]|jgi:HAD superfamily hydrolase (TIGR01509 family)